MPTVLPFVKRLLSATWNELYQDLPSLLVVLMSPNCGYGRSNCERAIVALLRPLPGKRPANGFTTVPVRKVLLASIAAVRELSVFRYWTGSALMLRVISMS